MGGAGELLRCRWRCDRGQDGDGLASAFSYLVEDVGELIGERIDLRERESLDGEVGANQAERGPVVLGAGVGGDLANVANVRGHGLARPPP